MLGAQQPTNPGNVYGHSRTRTTSSSVFPAHMHTAAPLQMSYQGLHPGHNRRSPSVNTFSTSSSIPPPAAYRTSSSTDLRRSISSRSGGTQPSGYVALLRKQKATVWCDRAQYEDPRITAQQRAAKMRANREIVGSNQRTSTGISAGKVAHKIRHHGKTPVVGFSPGENHVGVGGVPLRLSATEVEAESSEDEELSRSQHHRRTGSSGRSSIGSARRGLAYRTSMGAGSMNSRRWSPGDTPERTGSLVSGMPEANATAEDNASFTARSTHSGSDAERAERADQVADLGDAARLASNSLKHSALTREKSVKNPEELRRRGSVDERTATLTSQRLYIANPD
ncbi:hypothetical protein B0I35DRAFT_241610 [Stachybotrys elegans]|uniref:Uncharacterized protein n=1 Tax=Stachybotrys elegans TaxID=80388 RepID=A0A8K0SNY5_9HYPO|nr:hypothetical protein B0I35DRAFT_241610 [Stachybotrys elegans]